MNRCPKCSSTALGGPFYEEDMFGRESLEYYCRRCGYEEYGPTADQAARRTLTRLTRRSRDEQGREEERTEIMTPEQIEAKRSAIQAAIALVEGMSQHWMEERWKAANDLCDLALQSLSQEAVREEALEEAARVCDIEAALRRYRQDHPLPGDTDMMIQGHKAVTAGTCATAIRALKRLR